MNKGDHRAEMAKIVAERKAQGKSAWERTVNLKGIINNSDMTLLEVRDAAVRAIRASGWVDVRADDEDFILLIEELEECETKEDFNYLFNEVYNYADYDRVWIATA